MNSHELKNKILQIWNRGEPQPAKTLPPAPPQVSDEELVKCLIERGLRVADAETVMHTIWRVRRLARWYDEKGKDVSEHETRTFLIVPILQALGWSEQRMKIEWNNVDIAFSQEPYARKAKHAGYNNCIMVLESKRMWVGLSGVEKQAQSYAKQLPECSRLAISDGIRYWLYQRKEAA